MGPLNDYGQTLETGDRAKLLSLIADLQEKGIQFIYLATWRDPFSDPWRYATEVFRAWGLGERHFLLVFVRGEDRKWRVALHYGSALSLPFAEELRRAAEHEANRARPGYAAARFASALLSALEEGLRPKRTGEFPWRYVLYGVGAFLFLLILARRICPRCGRPLRRVESFSGIMWVCPRCRYTRTGLRRGRRPGGRRGFLP